MITQERLKEVLDYDPESGEFRWKANRKNAIPVGGVAGSTHRTGYRQIKIDGILHKSHRLAWLYMYGEMPTLSLDHIDGNKSNNRIANLRQATKSQNGYNQGRQRNNTTGYKGVTKSGNCWLAQIRNNGVPMRLGRFPSPELAYAAYCDAANKFHGEFARL